MASEFDGTFESVAMPDGNMPLATGWVAVSFHWVNEQDGTAAVEARRRLYGRWFKITAEPPYGGSIYRVLRFSSNLTFDSITKKGGVVIDWSGWIDLNGCKGDEKSPLKLKFREATCFERHVLAAWRHPDPGTRQANKIAVLSAALGVISVGLAVISLALSC